MPVFQSEIDALLARLDRGETIATGGTSSRTARRRAAERAELAEALAPDGRRTTESILREVHDLRSSTGLYVKTCAWCGQPFEAKRADARYCAEHKKPSSRKARRPSSAE